MRGLEANFLLVDRIASQMDPGMIPASVSTPHNLEAANRARLPPVHKARQNGWDGEAQMRRRLFLLEEMLRNQAGINVRQPSHHAAPFRAIEFESAARFVPLNATSTIVDADLLDVTASTAAAPGSTGVDFGSGQRQVPEGHRAVITSIEVGLSTPFTTVVHQAGAETGFTWDLIINGKPIILGRQPVSLIEVNALVGVTILAPHLIRPLASPLNLKPLDVVHLTGHLPAVDAGSSDGRSPAAGFLARVHTTVRGYVYQVRQDEPSIRGTLAD